MLDLAGISPGWRVLDVGAGTCEQTLLAARRTGPSGLVVAVDLAARMLEVAAAAAREGGLERVVRSVMDAQRLALAPDSFDAAIARSVLMLLAEPDAAFAEIRRVLKPGGRLAVIVFSAPERNPYAARPREIVRQIGRLPPEDWRRPGMFALAGPGILEAAYRRAGFGEVRVRAVPTVRRFGSVDVALRDYRDSFPSLLSLLSRLDESEQRRAWEEIVRELHRHYGSRELEVTGEVLVGVGVKVGSVGSTRAR
jgi:SAM-dependent methyltransferase